MGKNQSKYQNNNSPSLQQQQESGWEASSTASSSKSLGSRKVSSASLSVHSSSFRKKSAELSQSFTSESTFSETTSNTSEGSEISDKSRFSEAFQNSPINGNPVEKKQDFSLYSFEEEDELQFPENSEQQARVVFPFTNSLFGFQYQDRRGNRLRKFFFIETTLRNFFSIRFWGGKNPKTI